MVTRPTSALLFAAYLALLVWAPLPLGSNRPWAWAILESASAVLVFLWLLTTLRRASVLPHVVATLRISLISLGCWLGYVMIQALPMPPDAIRTLSPAAAGLYDMAFGPDRWGWRSLSLDPGRTLVELQKYLAYAGVFVLTLVLVDTRRRLHVMAIVLLVTGVMEALVGLYAHLGEVQLFAWDREAGRHAVIQVQGTFANRNHFAANLAMAAACGVGLLYGVFGTLFESRSGRSRLRDAIAAMLDPRLQLVVPLAIVIGAMLLSKSRAGNLALLLSFASVTALLSLSRAGRSHATKLIPVVLVIVLAGVTWAGAGGLLGRMTAENFRQDERLTQWSRTVPMVKDYPVFGAGAGNYEMTFPAYRDGTLRAVTYNHAHNDYLELVGDQGIVGLMLSGTAVLAALAATVTGYRRRRDPFLKGMMFASLVGSGAMLVHGALDYNFHIPANALWFFALLALGPIAATLPGGSQQVRRRSV